MSHHDPAIVASPRFNPFESTIASVARCVREDTATLAKIAKLRTLCDRILVSDAPRDFLASNDGAAFVNVLHDILEMDELYDASRVAMRRLESDLEAEFGDPQ